MVDGNVMSATSDDTRLQFDCSMANLSFCLAVISPSNKLQFQANSMCGASRLLTILDTLTRIVTV